MTREEVAAIMTYCQEHSMSYKDRLAELEIPAWRFYDAKSHYAKEQEQSNSRAGEFLQLVPGGAFVPMPSFASTSGRKTKSKRAAQLGGRVLPLIKEIKAGLRNPALKNHRLSANENVSLKKSTG